MSGTTITVSPVGGVLNPPNGSYSISNASDIASAIAAALAGLPTVTFGTDGSGFDTITSSSASFGTDGSGFDTITI